MTYLYWDAYKLTVFNYVQTRSLTFKSFTVSIKRVLNSTECRDLGSEAKGVARKREETWSFVPNNLSKIIVNALRVRREEKRHQGYLILSCKGIFAKGLFMLN